MFENEQGSRDIIILELNWNVRECFHSPWTVKFSYIHGIFVTYRPFRNLGNTETVHIFFEQLFPQISQFLHLSTSLLTCSRWASTMAMRRSHSLTRVLIFRSVSSDMLESSTLFRSCSSSSSAAICFLYKENPSFKRLSVRVPNFRSSGLVAPPPAWQFAS